MIYITVAENIDEALPNKFRTQNKLLKCIIYYFRNFFRMITEEKIDNKRIYILPNLNNKYLEKIIKLIKVKCINIVVLSEKLTDNFEFINELEKNEVKILNGKWLYNYIQDKIINYILEYKGEKIYNQEISILTNNINEINLYNIKKMARKVKVLNIVTSKEGLLKKIEKDLYEKEGINLNINNNYKRSLLKSDIIINLDLDVTEFNNYMLPKKACIINLNNNIKIYSKIFEGINIFNCEISIPKRFIKNILKLKDFNPTILYESFIYKRTSIENIIKEINEDKIRILSIIGQNGRIRKREIKSLNKFLNRA